MAKIELARGSIRHAIYLADAGLRASDLRELERATGEQSPALALCDAHRRSQFSFSAMADGVPVAMFGVVPHGIMRGSASIWLLGTDDADRYWVSFGRLSREVVEFLKTQFAILENWVDAENTVSIEWLKWLGFRVADRPTRYGVANAPFYHFEWRA